MICVRKSTGGRNITWTVEWFDNRKERLLTQTSSTCQISVAQPFVSPEQHKGRKRKRAVERSLTAHPITQDAIPAPETQNKPVQLDLDVKVVDQEPEYPFAARRGSYSDDQKTQEVKAQLAEADPPDLRDDKSDTEHMGDGEYLFFLLKPRTSSSKHVLIPITSNATLGECLKGRTVLEFPTIYVFPSSAQPLPKDYMLEEDYLKQEGEEQREFNDLLNELDPEILKRLKADGQGAGRATKEEEVDSKEILDVLKKDFGSLV
jgi:hypothetical protein